MKYDNINKPLVCMQTHSTCYKGTRKMEVKGVLWHSTGANNKTLKRYVQPYNKSSSGKEHSSNTYSDKKWVEILGNNTGGTDWNHAEREAGLNCWIGTLADGSVTTVQTMPWNYRPWGCGSGKNGSCNTGWVQFEICEDDLKDKTYFDKAYKEACEITAYICKIYNIDPNGTVKVGNVNVPTILCHYDSYFLGMGSNHGDVLHWLPKYGKSMQTVRADVANLLNGSTNWTYTEDDGDGTGSNSGGGGSYYVDTGTPRINTEPVLIKEFFCKKTLKTSTRVNFTIGDTFENTKYSWSYNLKLLHSTNASDTASLEIPITVEKDIKSIDLTIDNLIPNSVYSLEILAKDSFGITIKSPKIMFLTEQDYPKTVSNLNFNLGTRELDFKSPNSWGTLSKKTKGYRVVLYINNKELTHSDNLIRFKDITESKISENISSLFNDIKLNPEDIIQIGVVPWIEDVNGNLILSKFNESCSKPFYVEDSLRAINKVFLKIDDAYKRVITYLIK